jgi:signal transduction histidine kinase/CheY-like chemotaxis protein
MFSYSSFSIREKITRLILVTVAIVLTLMLMISTAMEAKQRIQALKQHLEIQTDITSANLSVAIAFSDPGGIKEILNTLKADPAVISATVSTANNISYTYRNISSSSNIEYWKFIPNVLPRTMEINHDFFSPYDAGVTLAETENIRGAKLLITADLLPLYKEIFSDFILSLSIVLTCLFSVLAISKRIVKQITQPISELATTTHKIAKDKNYQIRAQVIGNDEIADLTVSFNHMLDEIQERDENLEKTVLKRTAALYQAKQEAEQANKAKSEFLANMSHELRTPMNAVTGFNYLMSKTPLTAQQQDYLTKNSAAANSLLDVINDILDYSKIEADRMELVAIEFSLDQLLDKLTSILSIKAYEKDLEFIVYRDLDIPDTLIGDSLALRKVLTNLVANAIKFTHQGEVFVAIELLSQSEQDATIAFSVTDTGIGIAEEYFPALFTAFSQADLTTTRNFGGTGLGLCISQQFVQLMGGKIAVESQKGCGSRFFFTLTLKKGAALTSPLSAEKKSLVEAGSQVLLVESNKTSVQVLEKLFKHTPLSVCAVADLQSALMELQHYPTTSYPYKLLLINGKDIEKLPEAESEKILQTIKQNFQLPFMVMTSFPEQEKQNTVYAKVEKIIGKPVTAAALFNGICEILTKSPDSAGSSCTKIVNVSPEAKLFNKQILLAEDNPINQQIVCELLQMQGLTVTVVNDGQQAVNMLAQHQNFDLIFLDIQMPHLDGYDAAKAIRQQLNITQTPIIAITAHALETERQKCLAAGMNDHISKPIEPKLLSELLIEYLGQPEYEKPTVSSSTNKSYQHLFPQQEGIDFQEGLRRLKYNDALYIKLLKMFVEKHSNSANEIAQALKTSNFKEAASIAHTVKGAAANLGAHKISKLTGEIELLSRQNESVSESLLSPLGEALVSFVNSVDLICTQKPES